MVKPEGVYCGENLGAVAICCFASSQQVLPGQGAYPGPGRNVHVFGIVHLKPDAHHGRGGKLLVAAGAR